MGGREFRHHYSGSKRIPMKAKKMYRAAVYTGGVLPQITEVMITSDNGTIVQIEGKGKDIKQNTNSKYCETMKEAEDFIDRVLEQRITVLRDQAQGVENYRRAWLAKKNN
jgi:hypothetical protein